MKISYRDIIDIYRQAENTLITLEYTKFMKGL